MKAIIQQGYGSPGKVLSLQEVDAPTIKPDEVLVEVRATSVHADVWHVVYGWPYALRFMGAGAFGPKYAIPGTDLAGVVAAVGESVSNFKPGDAVFGDSSRRMQWSNNGAWAEYAAVPAEVLMHKPALVGFEQAASVPTAGYIAAINLDWEQRVKPGCKVLINGASGGVGTIALQLAKAHGAEVTAVASAGKFDLLQNLGAGHLVDYRQQDVTRSGQVFDVVYDVASNLTFSKSKRILAPDGIYIIIGHNHYGRAGGRVFGTLPSFFGLMARAMFDKRLPKVEFSMPAKAKVMQKLAYLLESGALTPQVDRSYPLAEAADALEYLVSGKACGKILLVP